MKQFYLFISLFLMAVSCSGDIQQRHAEMDQFRSRNGKLKVLSTIAMIGDLVKQVGGDYIDSITMIRGDLDPHSYQLVKGDDEKLSYADIVFYNGLGLEHGPSLQHYLENNPKAVGLGNKVMEKEPQLIIRIEGQLDPHIWMDMSLWAKTVPFIVETLIQKDPGHAEEYRSNGDQLIKQMLEMDGIIKSQMAAIPAEKRFLVTSHDAFNYFTRSYLATDEERINGTWNKRFAAPEGLAPESQLSTTHIQQIIDYLALHQVHVIFPESNVSKDSIRKIASAGKEKGLDIIIAPCCLYADAMGEPGSNGDTYLKMVKHNADWIIKHLEGN